MKQLGGFVQSVAKFSVLLIPVDRTLGPLHGGKGTEKFYQLGRDP